MATSKNNGNRRSRSPAGMTTSKTRAKATPKVKDKSKKTKKLRHLAVSVEVGAA
jgi:hypothetical protein